MCRVLDSNRNKLYLHNHPHLQKVAELSIFHYLGVESSWEEGFKVIQLLWNQVVQVSVPLLSHKGKEMGRGFSI